MFNKACKNERLAQIQNIKQENKTDIYEWQQIKWRFLFREINILQFAISCVLLDTSYYTV